MEELEASVRGGKEGGGEPGKGGERQGALGSQACTHAHTHTPQNLGPPHHTSQSSPLPLYSHIPSNIPVVQPRSCLAPAPLIRSTVPLLSLLHSEGRGQEGGTHRARAGVGKGGAHIHLTPCEKLPQVFALSTWFLLIPLKSELSFFMTSVLPLGDERGQA